MKVAVILPISALTEVYSDYHLCLADLVVKSQAYRDYYRQRRLDGHTVILDNSAHEHGAGETPEVLKRAALYIQPSEIVLPDVLFDWRATVERSKKAYPVLRELGIPLAVVPQGRTFDEWRRCLDHLLKLNPATIGISKDFEVWSLWGLTPLIEYCLPLGVQIHLLGWGRRLSLLPYYVEVGRDRLRGIDSAKPAVYAMAKIRLPLDLSQAPAYPGRPKDFFTQNTIDREILSWNIGVFKRAASSTSVETAH